MYERPVAGRQCGPPPADDSPAAGGGPGGLPVAALGDDAATKAGAAEGVAPPAGGDEVCQVVAAAERGRDDVVDGARGLPAPVAGASFEGEDLLADGLPPRRGFPGHGNSVAGVTGRL